MAVPVDRHLRLRRVTGYAVYQGTLGDHESHACSATAAAAPPSSWRPRRPARGPAPTWSRRWTTSCARRGAWGRPPRVERPRRAAPCRAQTDL